MIRVHKPELVPATLRERGAALTAGLCRKAELGEPLGFERAIYSADDVKQALRDAQHDKCCFCEAKLGHAQFGDVEHFRPKAAVQQGAGVPRTTGYYWLAYAWNNLYLCCELCNRRHKRGLFPLINPEQRVASHHRSTELAAERPVFIDPGREDPTAFIEFRREHLAAVDRSERGATTIEALQLNRPPLRERRRERRELLLGCMVALAAALRTRSSARQRADALRILDVLITAASDAGEYASMTRALLRQVAPWRTSWPPPAEALFEALRDDVAGGQAFRLDELRPPRTV